MADLHNLNLLESTLTLNTYPYYYYYYYYYYLLIIQISLFYKCSYMFRMGEERGTYRVLVGKPEGKRPLGRPSRRWVDNIRIDLQEVGCGYVDWIGLAQDRDRWRNLVSTVMNLRVP